MNHRQYLRRHKFHDCVCYARARYIWHNGSKRRSRKRKELFRWMIRLFSFNAAGSCSIRDIDDDYRYECCRQWWNELHKNKPYQFVFDKK